MAKLMTQFLLFGVFFTIIQAQQREILYCHACIPGQLGQQQTSYDRDTSDVTNILRGENQNQNLQPCINYGREKDIPTVPCTSQAQKCGKFGKDAMREKDWSGRGCITIPNPKPGYEAYQGESYKLSTIGQGNVVLAYCGRSYCNGANVITSRALGFISVIGVMALKRFI